MFSIKVDVPSELSIPLSVLGYNSEKLTEEMKHLLSVYLFKQNILSLGQAAMLSDLHLWDFIRLLNKHGIPIAECDENDITHEINTVEALLNDDK